MIAHLAPAAVVTCLLAGCRPDEVPDPVYPPQVVTFGAGDRLEARTERFEGIEELVTFHDAELDVDCAFETVPGPDGRIRCVPAGPSVVQGFFANDGCTDPVVDAAEPGAFVHDVPADSCAADVAWYTAAGPTDVFARNLGTGDCEQVPDITGVALAPFAGDGFVTADLVVEPRGAIDAWVARADDGAWKVVSGFDSELGVRVGQGGFGAGAAGNVWWPRLQVAYVYGDVFADGACTEPLAQKLPGDAVCPALYGVTFLRGEPPLYHLGAEFDPAAVWSRNDAGDCVNAGLADATDRFYRVAEPVEAEALEPLVELHVGTGRIRQLLLGTEDGEPVVPAGLWDELLGAPCFSTTEIDGEARCVPPHVTSWAWSDRSCENLVAELPDAAEEWGAASLTYEEGGLQVRVLGPEVDVLWTDSYASGSFECVRYPEAERPEGAIYREVGAPVPAHLLVRAVSD